MVICGQEFDFSLMNANDLDRFEDANERMLRRSAEESEQFRRGGVRLGDHALHRHALPWIASTRSSVQARPPVWDWMKTTWPPSMT